MVYKTTWHLEQRIWASVAKVYSGNMDEVRNLQERLTSYFSQSPATQRAIQSGLEDLGQDDLPLKTVETVVQGKFSSYERSVSRGIDAIFDGRYPSFLKKDVMEKRDWLIRYTALFHIFDSNEPLVKRCVEFVNDVQTLLTIYHNLIVERDVFVKDMGYRSYKSAMGNIERNVKDLSTIRSRNGIIIGALEHLRGLLYAASVTILFEFINSLKPEDIGRQKINLVKLETARVRTARKIEGMKNFDILGYEVLDFYFGQKTVMDFVEVKT